MSLLRQVMGPGAYETSETLQFSKFNGMNYHVWSDNMKAALQAKSLWGVVSGRELCPPVPPSVFPKLAMETPSSSEATSSSIKREDRELIGIFQSKEYKAWDLANEKFERWLNKDDAAMGLIRNAIEYTQRESIVSSKTSKLMWDQLKKDYVELQSGPNIHFYYRQLHTKQWDGNSSLSDHIGFYLGLRRRFIEVGHVPDDITIINTILLSLPNTPTWEVVKSDLLRRGTKLSINEVSAELMSVYERNTHEDAIAAKPLALVSKDDHGFGGRKFTQKSTKKGIKPKRVPKPDDTCHNCGEKGHWSPQCAKPKISRDIDIGSANLTINAPEFRSREIGKVLMATNDEMPAGLLLDSAASCHMISDRSYFYQYRVVDNRHVSVGGFNRIAVAGTGSIKFKTNIPDGVNEICLHDVLHIPGLGANLISLGLLQRAGATIRGISFGICLAWEGKDFLQANLIGSQGTLYRIKTMKTSLVNNQMAFIASESTMRLWHQQFGHISPRTIKTMIDQDLVTGLEIKLPRKFDRLCSGCAQGKSIHPPLPEHSKTKYGTNELIVIDLIGPMSISTWDGYNYALVAVEASKRYPKARLLK